MPNPSNRVPLGEAVHRVLSIPAAPPTGLAPLKELVTAQSDAEHEQAKQRLVAQMNAALAPAQVSKANIDNIRVISVYRHLHDPNRPYGTYVQREKLQRELLREAGSGSGGSAKAAARAAVLLAAQEGFLFGAAWLERALRFPNIDPILDWPPQQMQELRQRLADEHAQTSRLLPAFKDAAWTLQELMNLPRPDLDLQKVDAFIDALERLLAECDARPEFYWRAANVTWMLVNLAADRQRQDVIQILFGAAQRWRSTNQHVPEFVRWIDEAFATPWKAFGTPGVVFVTAAQLKAGSVSVRL